MATVSHKDGIVTIGGGTGTPVINQALLAGSRGRKGPYIRSVVTVMDSGGITGRMRTDSRGQEVAYSDALRTLLSLIDPADGSSLRVRSLTQLLRRRNTWGQDLGYAIFSHYYHRKTGFSEIQTLLENLTGIAFRGQIIPVTLSPAHLAFTTLSGQEFHGEHELDDKRMSADMVRKIWLEPPVPASPQALAAIKNARVIFFSCGSLYGSILVNLLPKGVKDALAKSKASKILLTNLASTRNETHDFKPADFINIFRKYTGLPKPLDVLIVPEMSRTKFEDRNPDVAARYKLEHSYFLGWEKDELAKVEKLGVKIITHNATTIDPKLGRIRHDPENLAKALYRHSDLLQISH